MRGGEAPGGEDEEKGGSDRPGMIVRSQACRQGRPADTHNSRCVGTIASCGHFGRTQRVPRTHGQLVLASLVPSARCVGHRGQAASKQAVSWWKPGRHEMMGSSMSPLYSAVRPGWAQGQVCIKKSSVWSLVGNAAGLSAASHWGLCAACSQVGGLSGGTWGAWGLGVPPAIP